MFNNCIYNPPKYLDKKVGFPIFIYTQFIIHSINERYNEIKQVLKENIRCPYLEKIFLLNERSYTNEEYGITSTERKKINEIIIHKRLHYKDFFENAKNVCGYVILCNSDIYLDATVQNIYSTVLYNSRSCFSNLRIETTGVFVPRSDSQDTWCFHTNNLPESVDKYDFPVGCDNQMAYMLSQDKFILYNEPFRIRSFRLHRNNTRDFSLPETSKKHAYIYPYLSFQHKNNIKCLDFDNLYEIIQNKTFMITTLEKYSTQLAFKYTYSSDTEKELKKILLCGVDIITKDDMFIYSSLYAESLIHSNCVYIDEDSILENNKIMDILNKSVIYQSTFHESMHNFSILMKYLNSKKLVLLVDDKTKLNRSLKASVINIDKFRKYKHWYFSYKIINLFLKRQSYDILVCLTQKYKGISNLWCCVAMKEGKSAINISDLYQQINKFIE